MIRQALLLIARDLRRAYGAGGQGWTAPFLVLLMTLLLPLSLGPAADQLAPAAPGLLVLIALFVTLIQLEGLFREDLEDGTLDAVLLAGIPAPSYAGAKILAHWLVNGLPLAVLGPSAGISLGLPPESAPVTALVLAAISALFTLLGAPGAALGLGGRRSGFLLAAISVPLYLPALIFGAASIDLALQGLSHAAPLLWLAALLAGAATLCPLAAGFILEKKNA